MRRIEQAGLGQREDARAHRAVERARIALLEVGAAAAADQQAVAGEGHALVVEHVGQAAVGVAGRGAHLERRRPNVDDGRRAPDSGRPRRAPLASASTIRLPSAASTARRRSHGRHGHGSRASTSLSPSSPISAASRRTCSNTGSISTASPRRRVSPAGRCRSRRCGSKSWRKTSIMPSLCSPVRAAERGSHMPAVESKNMPYIAGMHPLPSAQSEGPATLQSKVARIRKCG